MSMNKYIRLAILLLRLSLGWYFFYAGLAKVTNPAWSAAGYLGGAQTFSGLFAWFASPQNIGWVNFLNEWGLVLVGAALLLGFGVRFASLCGITFMLLYYFPTLHFPYAGAHAYLVDEHVIVLVALLLLYTAKAGKYFGISALLARTRLSSYPWMRLILN